MLKGRAGARGRGTCRYGRRGKPSREGEGRRAALFEQKR